MLVQLVEDRLLCLCFVLLGLRGFWDSGRRGTLVLLFPFGCRFSVAARVRGIFAGAKVNRLIFLGERDPFAVLRKDKEGLN